MFVIIKFHTHNAKRYEDKEKQIVEYLYSKLSVFLRLYNIYIIRMKLNNHVKTNTFELSVARGSPHRARAESQIDNINSQTRII